MSNIPKLRFPEFSGEWEEKRINDYAECRAGATPDTKNSDYWDNGTIPWMSSGEVNNKFIYSTEKKITQLGYDKSSTQLLPINTVVIALAGQGKTRGTVAITKTEVCTNQSLCGILNSSELNSEYLFQFLSSQYKQLRASSTGGDESRGGLNLQIIGNFRLPYTSFAEQQKIADFLSNVDSIIIAETKILNSLQKKKKALMQKLFTRQLRFKSDDGKDFPAWKEKKLGESVISISSGKNKKKNSAGNFPVYGSMGIIGYSEQYVYNKDCILVARVGANAGTLHIAKGKYDVSDNTLIIELNENELLSFYYFLLVNINLNKLNYGTGQPLVTSGMLKNIDIQLPCKAEQQKIADCLSSLDLLIQTQQKVVTTWQQRKKALLQQMFI